MPTLTPIFSSTWARIPLVCSICLVSLSGCSKPQIQSVVVQDSHELRPAWACPSDGVQCVPDPQRVTVDLGYIREILRTFEECRK